MVDEPVRGGFPDPSFPSLPGLERARALLRGQVPRVPLGHLTGIQPTQIGAGTATLTMPATARLQVQDGSLDVQIVAEVAMEFAALTTVPPATELRIVTLSTSPLRPCTTDHPAVVAKARVLNTGPTFTLTEVIVEDGAGRNVVHGTATFVVYAVDPPPPPARALPGSSPVVSYPTPDPYLRPYTGPFPLADDVSRLSWIRAVIAGEFPPHPQQELLGIRFVDVSEGRIVCSMIANEWLCGRSRRISGGVLAAFTSGGGIGALVTLMPAGYRLGVIDMSFNFFRGVDPDGHELLVRGAVVRQADGVSVAEAEVTDRHGNTVVLARHTGLFSPPRPHAERRTGSDRTLATVLFTDIVESTRQAEKFGDARWARLLEEHHALVRQQLQLFKGREVKTTGDGFLATFDSPGRAVQFARAIRDAVRRLGLEIRVGLHTGECEVSEGDLAGIAVHIAARIQGLAAPGDVLVSGTVRDLVTGSGLRFEDRGRHQLKGVEGEWAVFALADERPAPACR